MFGWLVLLAIVGIGWTRFVAGYPVARERYRQLRRSEVAFLTAAADALYPTGGVIPVAGVDADLPGYVDRYFGVLQPRIRTLMRLLFVLVEHATIVFWAPGRAGFRRFSSLNQEQRIAVLQGWNESGLFLRRLVFAALRAILTLGYLAHPGVMRHLGLAPLAIETPICEADCLYPPIGELPELNRLGPTDITEPSDGRPLDLNGPLHPDYAEASS